MNLDLLEKLIRNRSVSSDFAAVNRAENMVKTVLEANGVPCVMEHLNDGHDVLYASAIPGDKTPDLLLNAHLDVVPACREDQYEPRLEGDWMVGRGTSDCLSNVLCAIDILCRAAKHGNVSVGAVFTADEEIGGKTCLGMMERGYGAKKLVLVMDHGGDNLTIRQKGIVIVKLTSYGPGGHSAAPWGVPNPIDNLLAGYAKLQAVWKNSDVPGSWTDTMAACQIEAGFADNQIPETASMIVNFRYTQPDGMDKILNLVRETTGLEVTLLHHSGFADSDENAPVLQEFRKVMQKHVSGKEVGFSYMCGATDARHFQKLGVPFASIGTDGRGAHSADERIYLSSIARYSDMICDYLGIL